MFDWFEGMLAGDFGQSYSGGDVASNLSVRIPVTMSLVLIGLALTVVLSAVLGVLAASRGGLLDRGVQVASVAVLAVPGYLVALGLVVAFALTIRLFPATGYVPIQESFAGWLSHIFLPVVAVAVAPTFWLAIWVRNSIVDTLRQEWVRTLRSRGLSERAILYRHVLRNSGAVVIQLLGLVMIGLVGAAVFVERIFALPGLGSYILQAGSSGDTPSVLGAVTFMVFVVIVVNIFVDITNGFLNPKARVS